MSALVTNFSSDGQKRTVSFLSYSYQWPLCLLAPDAEPRQPGCSFWGQKIKAQVHQGAGRGVRARARCACACVPASGACVRSAEGGPGLHFAWWWVRVCARTSAATGQGKNPVSHARHSRSA